MTSKVTIKAENVREGNYIKVEHIGYPIGAMAGAFGKVIESRELREGDTFEVYVYGNNVVQLYEMDDNPDLDL